VAEYFYEGTAQEVWDLQNDFPNVSPPWRSAFYEWETPPTINSEEFGVQKRQPMKFAALVTAEQIPSNVNQIPFPFRDGVRTLTGAGWFIRGRLFTDNAPLQMAPAFGGVVDRGGHFMGIGDKPAMIYGVANSVMEKLTSDEQISEATKTVQGLLFPVWLAVSFLHCRNVGLTSREPSGKAKKRHTRKGWSIVWKTLEIHSIKKTISESAGDGTGLKQRLHICRGHFKDFAEGRGLFGKYHGTYWWADQVRGNRESGVVAKDYRVVP